MAKVGCDISPIRNGSIVTATWTAPAKYEYIWASVEGSGGYDKWVAARSWTWEDPTLEWLNVPEGPITVSLLTPVMKGERRAWLLLDSEEID